MSQSLLKIAADFTVQLASAVAIGDTTATLSSIADDDSVSLPSGLYGFTIDNGQSNKEYIICSLSGTALTDIKSISRQGASTTGFTKTHRRGAKVSITDWAILKRILDNLNGTTGFDSGVNLGYDGTPTGLTGNQFATVNYVLSVVNGGTVTFDKQVIANQTAGENLTANDIVYFKEADAKWWKVDADLTATFDQLQMGVAQSTVSSNATVTIGISGPMSGFTGLTAGSKYYASNTAGAITTSAGTYSVFVGWALSTTVLLFDSVGKTLPTQKEKDAMSGGGTFGTPSATNKFLTEQYTGLSILRSTQADGDLTISSGTTTIDLGSEAVVIKNYKSINITGTGQVAFSNPNQNGTTIIFLCDSFTNTSSASPGIGASGLGGAGGAGTVFTASGGGGTVNVSGQNNGSVAYGLANYQANFGTFGAGVSPVGTGGTIPSLRLFSLVTNPYFSSFFRFALPGAGGGSGGGRYLNSSDGSSNTTGAGGRGGGSLNIICNGNWNFTGSISVAGQNGLNGQGSLTGDVLCGGGGGGGGGMFYAFYRTLVANSGSVIVSGGTGGNAVGDNAAGSVAGGGGGGGATAGSNGVSSTNGVKTGGDGGSGISYITQLF
mgnify:CR=1 FL=1